MSAKMRGRDEVLQVLREDRSHLDRLGVKSLTLFGSVVRGEGRGDSDVDRLVEFQRPVGLFEFMDVKRHLKDVLGCRVDLGTLDWLKSRLGKSVLSETVGVASGLAASPSSGSPKGARGF